jgi:hypothetical protein
MTVTTHKPKCKLIEIDGNSMAIIAAVRKALAQAGMRERAEQFVNAAFEQPSQQALLLLCHKHVEVE